MVERYYLTKIFADVEPGSSICTPSEPSFYFAQTLTPNGWAHCQLGEPPEVCSTLYWGIRWIQEQGDHVLAQHAATDTGAAWLSEPILRYDSPLHCLFRSPIHERFYATNSRYDPYPPPLYDKSCKDLPHHLRAFGLDWPRRACQAIPISKLSGQRCLWAVPCVTTSDGIDYYFEPHAITLFSWLAVGKRVEWRYVVTTPDGPPRWGATPTEAILEPTPPPPYRSIIHCAGAGLRFNRLYETHVEVRFEGLSTMMRAPLWLPDEHLLNGHAMDLHSRYCWGTVLIRHSALFYDWVRRVLHDDGQRVFLSGTIPTT
jgi:hypothetical protein